MNKKELAKEMEWVNRQSKEVGIDLPPRGKDEPPITQTQIRYIRKITKQVDEEELQKLGTRQAASLIKQAKLESEIFTEELIEKRLAERQKIECIAGIVTAALFVVILIIFLAKLIF